MITLSFIIYVKGKKFIQFPFYSSSTSDICEQKTILLLEDIVEQSSNV